MRDRELHELRIKGEKVRQEMEQRILAEDLIKSESISKNEDRNGDGPP